jgi:hypothetical protein
MKAPLQLLASHALNLRGLNACTAPRSHGAILLSHRARGHERQAYVSGEHGTSHSWLRPVVLLPFEMVCG